MRFPILSAIDLESPAYHLLGRISPISNCVFHNVEIIANPSACSIISDVLSRSSHVRNPHLNYLTSTNVSLLPITSYSDISARHHLLQKIHRRLVDVLAFGT